MPPEQNMGAPVQNSHKTLIYSIIALVILLVVVVFLATISKKSPNGKIDKPEVTKENVVVSKVDLNSASGKDKLPQGFPTFIPVETSDAFESYSASYPERKLTQYTVSYKTSKSVADKYDEYLSFMTKNGFTFTRDGQNKVAGTLYGTKNGDDLLVVVSKSDDKTSVQISYLDRQ